MSCMFDIDTELGTETDKFGLLWTLSSTLCVVHSFIGWTHSAPYRGYGYASLRFGGNVVRRMGTQQQVRSFVEMTAQ